VSDRRLTVVDAEGRARTVSEDSAKAAIVHTEDAQLLMGFTGLARVGRYVTQDRLLLHIRDMGRDGVFQSKDLVQGIAGKLSTDFRRIPCDPRSARLSVLISGFRQVGPDKELSVALISNFQSLEDAKRERGAIRPWRKFEVFLASSSRSDEWQSLVLPVGLTPALRTEDVRSLHRVAQASGADVGDVMNLAARAVLRAAAVSRGMVGSRLMVTAVLSDGSAPTGRYFSDSPEPVLYFPDIVTALPGSASRFMSRIEAMAPASTIAVPPPTHRRQPCPCGSQRRYRDCHGKRGPAVG
jgi:hypothetical protein